MTLSKSKRTIYLMIIIALFSCLCFIGTTYLYIPVGSKVHLGNFFCIIAGLLCGGIVGGLSGAIGMGLSDLFCSYGPDTIIRTVIVKFLLGFFVGVFFRFIIKKERKIQPYSLIIGSMFLLLFITFLTLYLVKGNSFLIGERQFKISILLIVSLGIMALFFLLIFIVTKKLNRINQCVLIATSIASFINVILEFCLKIPFKMLFLSMSFESAFIYALTSLPSAIFTTVMTTVFICVIYLPVYFATRHVNKLNDLYDTIQEITGNYKNGQDEPKN